MMRYIQKISSLLVFGFVLGIFLLPTSYSAWKNKENYNWFISWSTTYMHPSVSPNMMNYGGDYLTIHKTTFEGQAVTQASDIDDVLPPVTYQSGAFAIDLAFQYRITPNFMMGVRGLYNPKIISASTLSVAAVFDTKTNKKLYMESLRTKTIQLDFYGIEPTIAYAPSIFSFQMGLGLGLLNAKNSVFFNDIYKDDQQKWMKFKDQVHNNMGASPLDMYDQKNALGLLFSVGMVAHLFSWYALDFNAMFNEDVYLGFKKMYGSVNIIDESKTHQFSVGTPVITVSTIGLNLGFNF